MTTPQLEKVYFNYILKNKKYFDIVKPYFYRNAEIQFVYDVLRDYMIKSSENKVPSNRQILDMVNISDKEGLITKEILKSILSTDLDEYSEKDFILPRFNSWILTNRIKTGAVDVVDETRNIDEISDFDQAVEAANRIKLIIDEMSSTNFIQDDNLGSDFDEAESHVQDSSKFKVKSGFETIDHMLGGGWDVQTLNCIMAETNNGKCFFGDGKIKIRKKGSKVENIKISKIFSRVRKSRNHI